MPVRLSSVALVAANLLPLVGVLSWGWDAGRVVTLYWFENVVIGALQVLKLALARPPRKLALIPFFVLHYGLFTFVHGVFLVTLFQGATTFGHGVLADGAGWVALALVASHVLSFAVNYVGGGEYRRRTPEQLMAEPYGRVVVLHVAILFGGFAVHALDSPVPLLAILVVGKTLLDLHFHRRQHAS